VGAASETRVELRVPEGEMRDALLSLGPELNDLLGSCAVRLLDGGGASLEETALLAHPQSVMAAGAAVEEAVTVSGLAEGKRAAHAMHVALHTTDAPKCGRCWRHVPLEAVGAGEGVLMAGGWTYRGCICPPGMHQVGGS
jgi:hypothetical protein